MFKGTGTAIITPFDDELNVDYSSLKNLVNFQIEGGVSAIIVLGTTGESPVIDDDERKKIIETVLEVNAGRVKVIVGTGTNNTVKVAKYNKMAEDLKVDGLLIVNPYYNKSTQRGIVEHYGYLAERTTLPIIVYNVPSRTAMNILPETILEMHSKNKNIKAVKEASGDISQIAYLIAMKPKTLTVYSGNDDQTLPIMALGGAGVISVFSNVFPHIMAGLTSSMLAGSIEKAQEINNRFLPFMNLLFLETNPMPIKAAVSMLGLCKNTLRLPLLPVTKKTYQTILESYKNLTGV